VKKLREVIQDTYFNTALRLNNGPTSSSVPRSPSKSESGSVRSSRDLEDMGGGGEPFIMDNMNADRGSEASYGSSSNQDSSDNRVSL
jgi:hypothetical protein